MKNPNVHESPVACDNLLIKYAESGVKRRVPKFLLVCSMRKLNNELIASPDDGGLLGARHTNTNDVIFSDTMICSLAPSQLRPMTDHHNIIYGCATCNTSKYFQ